MKGRSNDHNYCVSNLVRSVKILLAAPYNLKLFIFSYEKTSSNTKAAAQEVMSNDIAFISMQWNNQIRKSSHWLLSIS